jgi:hypothetical protein
VAITATQVSVMAHPAPPMPTVLLILASWVPVLLATTMPTLAK